MEVHALFEDESASRLVFEFFAPSAGDAPVRVACLGIQDPAVVHSAQVGCLSAYHILSRRGQLGDGDHFFPSCQFGDARANLCARGGSAGLAFSLKFACETIKQLPTQDRASMVAATGVVENGGHDAAIGRVEGIEPKLRAALALLGRGDLVIIPQANADEVPVELCAALEEQGILLRPTATVAEALALIVPPSPPVWAPRMKWPPRSWAVAISIAVVAAGGWWWYPGGADPDLAALADHGEYLEASAMAQYRLDRDPGAPEALLVHQQLAESLGLELSLVCLDVGTGGMQPRQVALGGGGQRVSLREGDLYRFFWEADDSCYLQVVKTTWDGNQIRMTPDLAMVRPGQRYTLPADTREWFRVEQADSGGIYFFVASRRPGRDLEALWRRYHTLSGEAQAGAGRVIREHLDLRQQAAAQGLAGVFYAAVAPGPQASTTAIR